MRTRGWLVLVAALAATGLPTLAGEVIYFTNGKSMDIRSHTIEDDMIQVDLDDDSSLSFPKDLVERIEDAAGQSLQTRGTANQIVASPEGTAWGEVPTRMRRGGWDPDGTMTQPADPSVPGTRPFASATNPRMSSLSATGRRAPQAIEGSGRMARTATTGRRQLTPSSAAAAQRPVGQRLMPKKGMPQGDPRRGK